MIKDIGHYLLPPDQKPVSIAPSVLFNKRGVGTANGVQDTNGTTSPPIDPSAPTLYPFDTSGEPDGNPTVLPLEILQKFHWTFLIRHPRSSVPSYYRCTVPPLSETTGFHTYMPSEAGYDELRRLFEYLRSVGEIGPETAGATDPPTESAQEQGQGQGQGSKGKIQICVVDADDLLDDPQGIVKAFCATTNLPYDPAMLKWDTEADARQATEAFAKWNGFHNDAMGSTELRKRVKVR